MKTRVIPRIGDIVEVKTPKGLAFVQYSAKHTLPPVYGDLVRVLPGLYPTRCSDFSALAQMKENYFVFTPISAACRRKQATIVSNEPVPPWAQGIPLMRMATWYENGKGRGWYLWDGSNTYPAIDPLNELTKLSIASVWGHEFLIDRLAEGWLPSDEPVEEDSPPAVILHSPPSNDMESEIEQSQALDPDSSKETIVRHYLYFSSEMSARDAGKLLECEGYLVQVERSGGDDNWLLQPIKRTALNIKSIDKSMVYLKNFAAAQGGEYDGWDVFVDETDRG